MKTLSITTKKRTQLGKKSTQALRKAGEIPCVMYGGEEIIHFHAPENNFRHLIYTHEVFLIELDIDGKKHNAIMKELQFHPVSDKVIHIDFVQVFDDKPTIVSLPIKLTGSSIGIHEGGKLRQRRRYLKIKGLVKDMPEVLEIDITNVNIGNVIKVSDLSYNNLELLDPGQSMVVGVVSSRLAAKGMEEGVVAEVEEKVTEEEGKEEGEESTEEAAPSEK